MSPPSSPDSSSPAAAEHFQLSQAALVGPPSPRTLRVQGRVGELEVTVLIDSGSSHNIMQPRVAEFLGLPMVAIKPFSVVVGNGDSITCSGFCADVPVNLAKQMFHIPFFIIPIHGADLVLGVQWLQTLGSFLSDYTIPSIQFTYNNTPITLTGNTSTQPSLATFSQYCRFVFTDAISSAHTISFSQIDSPPIKIPPHPEIAPILTKFASVFSSPQGLPPNRPLNHHIHLLPQAKPVNVRPYRYPQFQKEIMTSMIRDMLAEGVIRPSTSPFSSPVLLVRKKDGTWRFCVDYRALNNITVKDRFPIPTIDELLDELYGAKIFSKLDLRSGYHQIRVAPEDCFKTAFRTVDGHFEFLVMPFGLSNAPSTFQATMNEVFRAFLRKFVLVFFDDILIYSPSWDTHIQHLQQVLELLDQHQLFAKLSKCEFAVPTVAYLGHIISQEGVAADPEKLKVVQSWPPPHNLTALRGFLGLTGFYRRFVRHYASIAEPLTSLLKTNAFCWNERALEAFQALKMAMTTLPVLGIPNFDQTFEVTTDASNSAVGAVLSQQSHPIAFFSRKLCPKMRAASAYEREMFAVTAAVKKWRHYLLGRHFFIYTDHRSLKELITQTIQTPAQHRWLTKLLGFDYEIVYTPGKTNLVADALSRVDVPSLTYIQVVSEAQPLMLEQLRIFYASDPVGQQLTRKFTSLKPDSPFKLHQGLWFYKGRLFIPSETQFRTQLLQEFHTSPVGGHSGVKGTLARLTAAFSWPNMAKDVKRWVQECSICQQQKYSTHRPYGLLNPLPIPSQVWEDIAMDFITKLPPSHGKSTIWVVIDRLTKYAHFIALPAHYSAVSLAPVFMSEIYRLHGMPKTIVSDRDRVFVSRFWQELFKLNGTTLCFSSAYHPQSDGQTEVTNRILQTFLRYFVSDTPKLWVSMLPLAEHWYNSSYQSAIKMTPFEALYGRPPPNMCSYVSGSTVVATLDETLAQRHQMLAVIKLNLQKAQSRMRSHANNGRMDKEFEVGTWVWLRLQPYRQNSVRGARYSKFTKRFFGPYQIVKRIGTVAYELLLPPEARIHPVFHVSKLKQFFGQPPSQVPLLDEAVTGTLVPLQPTQILDTRKLQTVKGTIRQVLVRWEGLSPAEDTWENWKELLKSYPHCNLEDKVEFDGEGSDTEVLIETNVGPDQVTRSKSPRPQRKRKAPSWARDYVGITTTLE